MRNLIAYIIRYQFFILFLIVEILSFIIIVNSNHFHNAKIYNLSHNIAGKIQSKTIHFKEYFKLRQVNSALALENIELKNELEAKNALLNSYSHTIIDTSEEKQYIFIAAKVINNSTNKIHNYITLNKGKNDGISPDMAVISDNKIVGIVNYVSDNYSSVISVLNPRLKISAKIKKNNHFGSLYWEGKNRSNCTLSEIPHHIEIAVGDTIVTSGYSAIFPEGILIGNISEYKIKDGNFYEITVKLAHDMGNLNNVMAIKNVNKEEQRNLEKMNFND